MIESCFHCMKTQCHLKHPNKKGLATVVNYERSSRVALARVLDHSFALRFSVQPKIFNLSKRKLLIECYKSCECWSTSRLAVRSL